MSPIGHHRLDMLMPRDSFFCPVLERLHGKRTHSLGFSLLPALRHKGKAPFACSCSISICPHCQEEELGAHKNTGHTVVIAVDEFSRKAYQSQLDSQFARVSSRKDDSTFSFKRLGVHTYQPFHITCGAALRKLLSIR